MGEEIGFGTWLKQRRKELGILQEQLAEKIGCSLTTLEKIESGKRRPSGQIAELLAGFFRIPVDEREAFVAFARTGRTVSADPSAEGPSSRAPWRSAHVRRTNLPAILTGLVGREEDRANARSLLIQPKVRLLTFTGPPGTGKTRLALQVASDAATSFEDGVYLVDLAPVGEPEWVLAAAAHALGVAEEQGRAVEEILFDYVRERRMLLLFDNFEHVLDAAPSVVKLLEASPWLKVLATSREPLHVRGERRYPVPALDRPDPAHLPPLKELAAYPSVELFVERVQAVAPDFVLSEDNCFDVASVCAELEGLPLAIELAAARADTLQPGEIRGALDSRLKLLTEGARDLPPRQRTLRSAIEWSYDLLQESEQRLFRRLAVFVGGFTPAAAEAVCRVESRDGVASLLLSLAEKNLIAPEMQAEALRYGILETIREYASEKLRNSEEAGTTGKAHALYFMRLAEEAKSSLVKANDPGLMHRLGEDFENVRSALHWTRDQMWGGTSGGDEARAAGVEAGRIGLRLAGAFWPYWYIRGYITEGRSELEAMLSAAKALPLRPQFAEILNGAGALAYEQGDNAAARSFYQESLAIKREAGDAVGVASTLNNLGILAHEEGDHESARRFYEEGLAVSREIGDKVGLSKALNNLAELVHDQGDYDYARALNEESLLIKREVGDKMGIAASLSNLGGLVHGQGDHAGARRLHEESLAIRREVGDNRGIASSLNDLGLVAFDQGDYTEALALHLQSLAIRREMGGNLLVIDSLLGLARVAAVVGEAQQGARLLGAIGALWKTLSLAPTTAMRTQYELGVSAARARLTGEAYNRAGEEGSAMSMEEAIACALEVEARS